MVISTHRSELQTVLHASKNNPALAAALDAVPNLADLDAQLELLIKSAGEIGPVKDEAELHDELRAGLADGKPLPDDLLDRVTGTVLRTHAVTQTKTLLERIAAQIAGERDSAIRSGADAILGNLHYQLATLLDERGDLVADAPSTAADAISAGRVADFEAAQEAAARYAQIRKAQVTIALHVWSRGDYESVRPRWADVATMRSPHEAFPEYLDWRSHGYQQDRYGNKRWLEPPWPDHRDFAEHLRWLAHHHEVEPWIPNLTELQQRIDKLAAPIEPRKAYRERIDDEEPEFTTPKPQRSELADRVPVGVTADINTTRN